MVFFFIHAFRGVLARVNIFFYINQMYFVREAIFSESDRITIGDKILPLHIYDSNSKTVKPLIKLK